MLDQQDFHFSIYLFFYFVHRESLDRHIYTLYQKSCSIDFVYSKIVYA